MHPAKRTRKSPEKLEAHPPDSKHVGNQWESQPDQCGNTKCAVFKCSKKFKVDSVTNPCSGDIVKRMKGSSVKSKAVIDDNIASVDTANSHKHEDRVKCEACGKALAADETLNEHVVSVHLTIEGLCNICGEDSEDFIEHFKVHLKSCNHEVELDTLDTIKKENIDVDDNQNFKNYHESDLVVKDENEEEDS